MQFTVYEGFASDVHPPTLSSSLQNPFCRHDPFNPWVPLAGGVESPCPRLEACFNDVMDIVSVHDIHVQIESAVIGESLKKLTGQLHIKFTNLNFW